jgi:hypothetical protein
VFDPTASAQFPDMQVSLEQFLHLDLEQQDVYENLTELLAEFQLFQHESADLDELKDIYGEALTNLLKVTPNLHVLHPVGGHFYFPASGVSSTLFNLNSGTFRQLIKSSQS